MLAAWTRDIQILLQHLRTWPATSLTVLACVCTLSRRRHCWAAALAVSLACDATAHTWGSAYQPHITAAGLLLAVSTLLLPPPTTPPPVHHKPCPQPACTPLSRPRPSPPVLAMAVISPPGTPGSSPRSSVASGAPRASSGGSSLRTFQQQLAALQAPPRGAEDVQLHWRLGTLAGQKASLVRKKHSCRVTGVV